MTDTEQLAVDTIRVLAMDAVQQANSGHPGMPMGMADLAVVLWSKFFVADPHDPLWPDRDRFIVSNGHGSMLLYALLHLAGYPMSMDDLRNFRQFESPTPGHPELDQAIGIETTTGPLGQGFGNGVGLAIAEERLRAVFGSDLVNHRVYGFVSDGDLMEGVAAEAASLAGHLGLGRLIYLYDDNAISLVGPTEWTFSEDVPARFASYGWHTLTIDGHDRTAIEEALQEARAVVDRPSLISAKTHIGYGSPNKQDNAAAHGSPLGEDEVMLVKERFGWELPPFEAPSQVYEFFATAMERGRQARQEWNTRVEAAFATSPQLRDRWESYWNPNPVTLTSPSPEPGSGVATRKLSEAVIQELAGERPDLIGGAADLASSTNTLVADSSDFSVKDRLGRNLRFGVREHAMGAIVNGLNLHGGVRAYGATFLTFSDYMRPSVRLAALMGAPSIWVWSHDSIFLGEDGPTHQPIEHLAALRAIPGLWVVRPADAVETAVAWETAINRSDGPTALILTRQGLPMPAEPPDPAAARRGGYVRRQGTDAVLVATGSEVWVAEGAAELLAADGIALRVVSLPCREAFAEQDAAYRQSVLGVDLPVASLEAAVTFGWEGFTGSDGLRIGVDHFGASAPWQVIAEKWGFVPEAVAARMREWLE